MTQQLPPGAAAPVLRCSTTGVAVPSESRKRALNQMERQSDSQ